MLEVVADPDVKVQQRMDVMDGSAVASARYRHNGCTPR